MIYCLINFLQSAIFATDFVLVGLVLYVSLFKQKLHEKI